MIWLNGRLLSASAPTSASDLSLRAGKPPIPARTRETLIRVGRELPLSQRVPPMRTPSCWASVAPRCDTSSDGARLVDAHLWMKLSRRPCSAWTRPRKPSWSRRRAKMAQGRRIRIQHNSSTNARRTKMARAQNKSSHRVRMTASQKSGEDRSLDTPLFGGLSRARRWLSSRC